jgi:hypothetical protein
VREKTTTEWTSEQFEALAQHVAQVLEEQRRLEREQSQATRAAELEAAVASYRREHPGAGANEIQRALQFRRQDVLRAARALDNAKREEHPGSAPDAPSSWFPSPGNRSEASG